MVKYVSKDIICAKMMHCNFRSPDMTVSDFINDELPAADVQPVKHGKWDTHDVVKVLCSGKTLDGFCQCEACGDVFPLAYSEYNYCPNCGARMDGEQNDH